MADPLRDDEAVRGDDPFRIANEFASVVVRKVYTRNGERLEIVSPKRGHRVRLDALELEALSWQDHRTLSRLLERPLGPSGEDGPGAPREDAG